LCFSRDLGKTWEQTTGLFGRLQIMALGYADAGDHTIIYAATNGGQAGAVEGTAGARSRGLAATESTPVAAGVYRYVVVKTTLTLRLRGLTRGALRLGKRVTAEGVVTPGSLAGAKVTLTVQRRQHGRWLTVTSLTRQIGASGAWSSKFRPAKKGSYRIQAKIAMTATNTAATTKWLSFKVR